VKHIIWDFNGTLLNDAQLGVDCDNYVFDALGLPRITIEDYRRHMTMPVRDFYTALGVDLNVYKYETISRLWLDRFNERAVGVGLVPGAMESIARLGAMGFTQSILSASYEVSLREQCAALGLEAYMTAIDGLHAAGECSCISVHGANRLGGNSVAEVCFFGKQAGIGVAETARRRDFGAVDQLDALQRQWTEKFNLMRAKRDGISIYEIRNKMAEAMWNGVGIFREEESMKAAEAVIDECLEEYKNATIGDDSKLYNMAFMNYVEVGNVLSIAKAVCMGAIARKESRGSHSRQDYPVRDDKNFMKHTLVTMSKEGKFSLDYRDVVVTHFEPQERKY